MEQAVWVFFGVLAVLIALAIVANIFAENIDSEKTKLSSNALSSVAQYCDFVCNSETGTRISKEISFASGSKINASKNIICIEYKRWRKCAKCKCDVNNLSLDLDKPEIIEMYNWHVFKCVFEKIKGSVVSIECFG